MVFTFLLDNVIGHVFRNTLQIALVQLSSATTTPIGNSITSFTRVVASDSRFRIAHRTLQSSGQPQHSPIQLLIWPISMFRFLGCGMWASGVGPLPPLMLRRHNRTSMPMSRFYDAA
jgi:hypothetical protein